MIRKIFAVLAALMMLLGCMGGCSDAPEKVHRVQFSEKPLTVFFGDQQLVVGNYLDKKFNSFMGDNAATYLAATIYATYAERNPESYNYSAQTLMISGVKHSLANNILVEGKQVPDLLVICLSDGDAQKYLNDAKYGQSFSPEKYRTNLQELFELTKDVDTVLLAEPYTLSVDEVYRTETMSLYQTAAKEVAEAYENVVYMPMQDAVDTWVSAGRVTDDGILNHIAQVELTALMAKTLNLSPREGTVAPTETVSLMCTGDSITDCGRDKKVEEGVYLGNGYAALLNGYLQAMYPQIPTIVYNSGISGNTLQQLNLRWKKDVQAVNANHLVMMIGINDAYGADLNNGSGKSSSSNYERMLGTLLSKYAASYEKIVLVTPFWVADADDEFRTQYVDLYIEAVKSVAENYANITVVDMQATLDAHYARHNSKYLALTADHCHLNAEGHRILMAEVLRALGY